MSHRSIAVIRILVVALVIAGLVLYFPQALEFVEMGARELRYFWWIILLVALAIWLIWGLGRKSKK